MKNDVLLQSMLIDLQERLFKLRICNRSSEVNYLCDDLQSQVMLAFDSAVKHLAILQEKLMNEISKYRLELLMSKQLEAIDDLSCMDSVSALPEDKEASISFEDDLSRISSQIDELSKAAHDSSSNLPQSHQESLLNQANDLKMKIKWLEKKTRLETFRNQFMKYNENGLFNLETDHLGKLEFVKDNDVEFQIDSSLRFSPYRYHLSNSYTARIPDAHFVTAVIFLSESKIATCSTDGRICFWHKDSGPLGEIRTPDRVLSLVKLPTDGCVASGHGNGAIFIWSFSYQDEELVNREEIPFQYRLPSRVLVKANTISLIGHEAGVISMSFSADKLISCSSDGTIKIWNPFKTNQGGKLLLSIPGSFGAIVMSPLGILSNNYLVTCSYDAVNGIIAVYNPKDGDLALRMETGLSRVTSLLVLSNDDIALGSLNSIVQIFSLTERIRLRTLSLCDHQDIRHLALINLPGGYLMTATTRNYSYKLWDARDFHFRAHTENECFLPVFQVWDLKAGKLVKKFPMTRVKCLFPLALGEDGKTLAFGADHHSLIFWKFSHSYF